jgi:hypothetical protein
MFNCRCGQIDPDAGDWTCTIQAPKHLAGSRPEIDGDGFGREAQPRNPIDDRIDDDATDARLFERGARVNGRFGVAGRQRSTILRLQQIDVTAARNVERMTGSADKRAIVARQRQAASAHAAGES